MCTTMMVLTTIALILRQRFSNKIKPSHTDGGGVQSGSVSVTSAQSSGRCLQIR
uniref:Uncharacterized protein n=1 Tax=Monopterus albus TaxID=43700 RepID=A0A3Q3KDN8_MONAL